MRTYFPTEYDNLTKLTGKQPHEEMRDPDELVLVFPVQPIDPDQCILDVVLDIRQGNAVILILIFRRSETSFAAKVLD